MSSEKPIVVALDDTIATINISHTAGASAASSTAAIITTSAAAATSTSASAPLLLLSSSSPSSASQSKHSGNESLEHHYRIVEEELQALRESEQRLKQQNTESQRRERILVRRLALKEQEMQDYVTQIGELKAAQAPGPAALRTALLDPAVNIMFQKLKVELQTTRARLEETQNELSAWKFTPDSTTGKRLMAKCRLLYQENEELGKMTSNGRLAKLEGDLALQKSFSEEVKKSQSELDDLLQELDEDVEGMQSTILFLQQELKTSKDTISGLEIEMNQLKNGNRRSVGHDDDRHAAAAAADDDDDDNECDDENNCEDLTNDRMADEEDHGDNNEIGKKQKKNHHVATISYGNGVPSGTVVCAGVVGNGNETMVNGATITNCSVVLRAPAGVDREVLKVNNSERILRKDKQSGGGNKKISNPPRTLRSSRRNDVVRTAVTAVKVINKHSADTSDAVDGIDNDVDDDDDDNDDNADIVGGAERNNGHRRSSSDDLLEHKFNNNKRSFDESDSNECSSGDESGGAARIGTAAVLQPPHTPAADAIISISSSNHKQLVKKVRRSSVLSLDLNEEDSRIDCGEEDRTIIVNSSSSSGSSNGTKVGRTTD